MSNYFVNFHLEIDGKLEVCIRRYVVFEAPNYNLENNRCWIMLVLYQLGEPCGCDKIVRINKLHITRLSNLIITRTRGQLL
jgi:hypothetical protein